MPEAPECTGKADCECKECGPLPPDIADTFHKFESDPVGPLLCSLCGEEEESEIHTTGEDFKDPAMAPDEAPESKVLPPITSETTIGDITHVILQWQSAYHMLRKGNKEGPPQPLSQPCFLTVSGVTYMALSNLFSAQGVYKVEKLK